MVSAFDLGALVMTNQVHGTDVLVFDDDAKEAPAFLSKRYDAIVTKRKGVAVGIRTADCLPVLIAAPGIVAAAHAGWRGLVGGVIENTIEVMKRSGAKPTEMCAAVGPHIQASCYEVGPDVADPFRKRFGNGTIKPGRGDRSYLALGECAKIELERLGLKKENIELLSVCTHCERKFNSYRRDGSPAGRQVSFIELEG